MPKHVPAAGSFLYFVDPTHPVLPEELKVKIAMDANKAPIVLKDIGVLDWKRDHPILHDLQLEKLYVASAVKLDVPQTAQVLLDGLKCPLLVLQQQGNSTHLICPFDVLQSNWPLKVSFPVFLHNAMQFLARSGSGDELRQSFGAGRHAGHPAEESPTGRSGDAQEHPARRPRRNLTKTPSRFTPATGDTVALAAAGSASGCIRRFRLSPATSNSR